MEHKKNFEGLDIVKNSDSHSCGWILAFVCYIDTVHMVRDVNIKQILSPVNINFGVYIPTRIYELCR